MFSFFFLCLISVFSRTGVVIVMFCSAIIGFFIIIFSVAMLISITRFDPKRKEGAEANEGPDNQPSGFARHLTGTIGFFGRRKFSYGK